MSTDPKWLHSGFIKKALLFVLFLFTVGALLVSSLDLQRFFPTNSGINAGPKSRAPLLGHKVVCLTNPAHARAFEVLAAWFLEETGAAVQNIVVPSQEMLSYPEQDFLSQNPQLDVIMIRYHHLGILREKDMLVDLTDLIRRHESLLRPDDFIPSLYAPYSVYDGKFFALPFDGDTHLLFYRKSVFARHSLTAPRTWEEYLQALQTITEKERNNGMYGSAIMMHPFIMFSVSSYMNRLTSRGGRLFDDMENPTVNSPEGVAALTALLEEARHALPTPQETDWDVSREAFLSGKVAMVEQWTDIGIMAEDPSQSLIAGDWDVVPLPRGTGPGGRHPAPLNSGFSLAISKKSPNREAAEAFLLFASRPDIAKRLCLSNVGIDPTRTSVLHSDTYRAFTPRVSTAIEQVIQEATPWPRIPQATELLNHLAENLLHALEGRLSPREALETTQKQWEQVLGR